MFHGVAVDSMEEEMGNDKPEIKKNFLEHKIRTILFEEWDIDCQAQFQHVFR